MYISHSLYKSYCTGFQIHHLICSFRQFSISYFESRLSLLGFRSFKKQRTPKKVSDPTECMFLHIKKIAMRKKPNQLLCCFFLFQFLQLLIIIFSLFIFLRIIKSTQNIYNQQTNSIFCNSMIHLEQDKRKQTKYTILK